MTLSFWRYLHLALAVFSSVFLFLAATTGIILAVDAVCEKTPPYKVGHFDTITLQESLPNLRKIYPEITELSIDHNQFVTLQAIDKEGNDVHAYIDPTTGKILGKASKKSNFIQWITSLHRSLFLHETGRILIGINSFILVLIALTGLVLVVKRQKGIRKFFSKIVKDYFAQYYHVVLGRIALVPILIIALSGTYLSLNRFQAFDSKETKKAPVEATSDSKFDFKNTPLSEVKKIEFPFSDDEEDFYIFELNDRKIEVNQYSYEILKNEPYATSALLSELSLDLHTGRANMAWAFILALASANILFFIYSGFAMTFKRRAVRIKNKFKATESKHILLVGSENGSSLRFANAIYKQLIGQGETAFISQMNEYQSYPKAENLIVFSSTYGLGDAPSNATKFENLVHQIPQNQNINYSVVGFGSKSYPDFCGYAKKIDIELANKNWANRLLDVQTVNDKSAEEFVNWVKLWNAKTNFSLSTTPSLYNTVPNSLQKFMVVNKTEVTASDQTFLITFKTSIACPFTSGDLLAIYPNNDNRERLYSIANNNGMLQLAIKLHPHGLGSGFLHNLKIGDTIKARIVNNPAFHLPKKAKEVVLISNGTGIAPFLGMIAQNKKNTPIHLYSGFRQENETTLYYQNFANRMFQKKRLVHFHLAFSREKDHHYVMDLVKRDETFFANLLENGGHIMICGALKMQFDVENVLDAICLAHHNKTLSEYIGKGQILTDCY
ncbi:PepSY domain-containing protein [Flavobacterium agrisoli]|uniref:PepSY domain-containing protein n=1 Tax=Flavobacterium agrisoli TaxID=2793066 RepID=A0A934PL17_9FLAO|nr:PepSY domain-containing protein [Flavobacterium agrisoli]MBK0369250.1 PepSY domain-containing protein [Flavobacterium agrisoli]